MKSSQRLSANLFRVVVLLSVIATWLLPCDVLGAEPGNWLDEIQVYGLSQAPAAMLTGVKADDDMDGRAEELGAKLRERIMVLREAKQATRGNQRVADRLATLEQLHKRVGGALELRTRSNGGTPRRMKAAVLEPAAKGSGLQGNRDLVTARRFLRSNRALLRLDDPDVELRLKRNERDHLGRRHLRFSQVHRGLPVWPAELTVHLDAAGNVDLLNGGFVPTPQNVRAEPVLDSGAAIKRARLAIPGTDNANASEPALIVFAPGDSPTRLAWKLELTVSFASRWLVVVDAINGEILLSYDDVKHAGVSGSGVDLFGVTQQLNVWEEAGTFFMVDTSKPMFDPMSTPPSPQNTRGGIVILDAGNQPPNPDTDPFPPPVQAISSSADSWPFPDAVSASFGLSQVYDYYFDQHGRNSLDGSGGTMIAVVRVGQSYPNAFWNGQFMAFGDALPFAGGLDVLAHEMTHGVIDNTAHLIYQNQSGALNEAFADIFGEMVEAHTFGQPDWRKGNQLGSPIMNYADPGSIEALPGSGFAFPSKMSEFYPPSHPVAFSDNGGVHTNSSIINHAFYLLAEGMNGAIGIADAEQIFYRALTVHFVQNSNFFDARFVCIQSAEELFGVGSTQALRTSEAFDAVEIFEGQAAPPPSTFPEISGPDSTLFLFFDTQLQSYFLGRREAALGDGPLGSTLSVLDVAVQRPSVAGGGGFAVFVDAVSDVCLIDTDGILPEECLGIPGFVSSVAMSPDANRYGFVTLDELGQRENSITVVDLNTNATQIFPLRAPALDAGDVNTVAFADAMDFTADGRFLVYDALNEIQLVDGSVISAWSIYAIDLDTGMTLMIIPPIPGVNFAFPALSQTSDNFITFEAIDQVSGASTVLVANLATGEVGLIAIISSGIAVPGFTGDDSAIVYSQPDNTVTGFSLMRQPLSSDRLSPVGSPELWLADAGYGVIYRFGPFTPPAEQVDTDGDGVLDDLDPCLTDPAKVDPGLCGCGVPDVDSDSDGVPDCADGCPTDTAKTEPGDCGCGVPDVDSDADGISDCVDACPADPVKADPGICGCGVPDVDSDADGIPDCTDNCPTTANGDQSDSNGNGIGDVCEAPPAASAPCGAGIGGALGFMLFGLFCLRGGQLVGGVKVSRARWGGQGQRNR